MSKGTVYSFCSTLPSGDYQAGSKNQILTVKQTHAHTEAGKAKHQT